MVGEALAGCAGGVRAVRRMQQGLPVNAAVLRHEQKDQAIHRTQQLAVEVGGRHLTGAQGLTQGGVLRMTGEAFADDLQGLLDATTQVTQGTGALLVSELGPVL
jgi:hypothetical protein